jgi:type I restriction enzyme, S subunit
MSFPSYPTYKDSGVEWLGQVPEHWVPKKLGAISSLKGRLGWQGLKADEYREQGPYVVSSAHFDNHKIQWDECPRVSQERYDADRNIQLAADDVLLMKDGAAMGKLAFVDFLPGHACLNSHLLLFRPIKAEGVEAYHPRFAFFFMQTGYFQEHIKVNGTGATFLGISQDAIGRYQIVLPPLAEQTQIAAFLDRETAKIDGLVAEQRRLMALLKEKRQAVISHAVTRGLNPDVPMKPSGIEWLGDVPAHWRIGAIKYFVLPKNGAIKTGPFGSHLISADMQSGTIKVYNQRSVIDGDFESGDTFISDEKFEELASFETFPGDLLITTRGTIGRAAVLPENAKRGILHPCLLRLQPDNSTINTQFLKTLIQDSDLMKTQLSYLSNATTIEVIYSYTIASVIIPVPPLDEQESIMQFLTDQSAKFSTLATEAQRVIDLLQERRTALISAAVTGQIDVRELVSEPL